MLEPQVLHPQGAAPVEIQDRRASHCGLPEQAGIPPEYLPWNGKRTRAHRVVTLSPLWGPLSAAPCSATRRDVYRLPHAPAAPPAPPRPGARCAAAAATRSVGTDVRLYSVPAVARHLLLDHSRSGFFCSRSEDCGCLKRNGCLATPFAFDNGPAVHDYLSGVKSWRRFVGSVASSGFHT